jgi:tripartite ATP-independent transporter DctM subunit
MNLIVEYLDIIMFVILCGAILMGYPVTFTLAGVAAAFAVIGWWFGAFDFGLLGALSQRVFGVMVNDTLIAIPLFVFMGVVLERSRIAEDLLEEMGRQFGTLRGGLAVSVALVGALLAASTGIVGATVVTMALIALPSMLRNGYAPGFAAGTVCTAGTLGQIIPPSTLLIILSDVMSSSFQQAQFERGLFTVETISVGQIFAAALVPGLVLVGLYILYILARAWLRPGDAPSIPQTTATDRTDGGVLRVLVPPVLLIIAVLGSILGGIATPTEAAAVGAVGALLLAGLRLEGTESRWPVYVAMLSLLGLIILVNLTTIRVQRSDAGALDWLLAGLAAVLIAAALFGIARATLHARRTGILAEVVTRTMTITAMIFGTIIGASIFSLVFRGLGGDEHISTVLEQMPGGETGALLFVMALVFVLGFVLDFVEITVILLPIVAPVLMIMGHDPIWLSVLIAINLQTSFLTPPFGFSLFYLRGAAPKEITTGMIYTGVLPFIVLQIIGILVIWFLPALATAVPRMLFG